MKTQELLLPLEENAAPVERSDVAALVAQAAAAGRAVYPLGGQTALNYGARPRRPGLGLSLARLTRVVDYPARDLTITVEAGITLAALQRHLQAEGQRLPIDVPAPEQATIGGVLSCNVNGPRRFGCGSLRDFLLGFRAVDGSGTEFGSGGRVVKNAAGYDLGRMMVGALGTLGVLTQVTLLVRPQLETSAVLAAAVPDFDLAERLLAGLSRSKTLPVAVELLVGPHWRQCPGLPEIAAGTPLRLVVGFEGTAADVSWMVQQLQAEWQALGVASQPVAAADEQPLWNRIVHFATESAGSNGSTGLVAALNVRPGAVLKAVGDLWNVSSGVSVAAHAALGHLVARLGVTQPAEVESLVTQRLRPIAAAAGGNLVVLSTPQEVALPAAVVWGPPPPGVAIMQSIKQQFDPRGILNPGRFIFADGADS